MSLELIETEEQLIKNIESLFSSLESDSKQKARAQKAIKSGENFVVTKIDGLDFFSPSRFVGYYRNGKPNSIREHFPEAYNPHVRGDGGVTTKRISKIFKKDCTPDLKIEERYREFCKRKGVDLSKSKRTKPRKFWELKENISFNKNPKNSISSQGNFSEDECLTEEDHDCLNQLSTKEALIFKEALIKVRRGQAKYRENLEKVWDNACAVSGVLKREVLRASHIKPHSKCASGEHNDVNNGLLLRADLDALFDKGLITFSDEGKMKISPSLEKEDRDKLNFHLPHKLRKPLNSKQKEYLTWHFDHIFQK